jgi:hypothetical protein
MTREQLIEEARHTAAVTCREVELVLAEVVELDREGRKILLVDWMTGLQIADQVDNAIEFRRTD